MQFTGCVTGGRPKQHASGKILKQQVEMDKTRPTENNHKCHETGPRMETPGKTKTRLINITVGESQWPMRQRSRKPPGKKWRKQSKIEGVGEVSFRTTTRQLVDKRLLAHPPEAPCVISGNLYCVCSWELF